MAILDIIAILILIASLFLFINLHYLKLPTSIGLILLALGLSVIVYVTGLVFPQLQLAEHVRQHDFSEVLYRFVLSVLLFAGALNIDFHKMGKQLFPVLVLSFLGVLLSTFIIGTLVYITTLLLNIEFSYIGSLVFGALISSTDPVTITKTIREHKISKKLENKISGESMLNGGIAIAIALVLVDINRELATGGNYPFIVAAMVTLKEVVGGLAVGGITGLVGYRLLEYIDNDAVEVEVLITMALVMGGSFLAVYLGLSLVVVVVVMGIILGHFGRTKSGESVVGSYVYKFWKLMEETMVAILFVLIGFEMLIIPPRLDYFALGFIAVNIVIFARWASIYLPIKLMSKKLEFEPGTVSVLVWGALRGGLPVVVALSLQGIPGKDIIVTLTYIVVVSTVLYQGLTQGYLIKYHNSKSEASNRKMVMG